MAYLGQEFSGESTQFFFVGPGAHLIGVVEDHNTCVRTSESKAAIQLSIWSPRLLRGQIMLTRMMM